MKQSLVKLVDVILRGIEEHPEAFSTENGLRSWLLRQGYNKRDIEAAMKLVRPRFVRPMPVQVHAPGPVRVLSVFEEQKLTAEARNALVRLDLYGFIDPVERELILDRLNQFDGPVGLEELDWLLSWVVYGMRDVASQETICSLIEQEGDTFH